MGSPRATLVAVALAGSLVLSGCAASGTELIGSMPNATRTEAAQSAATGVIAAVAREATPDASAYYGRQLGASEIDALLSAVPSTLAPDPLLYQARFAIDPERSDNVTASVSLSSSSAAPAFEVALVWNPSSKRDVWRNGGSVEVMGDWTVKSVRAVGGE